MQTGWNRTCQFKKQFPITAFSSCSAICNDQCRRQPRLHWLHSIGALRQSHISSTFIQFISVQVDGIGRRQHQQPQRDRSIDFYELARFINASCLGEPHFEEVSEYELQMKESRVLTRGAKNANEYISCIQSISWTLNATAVRATTGRHKSSFARWGFLFSIQWSGWRGGWGVTVAVGEANMYIYLIS